MRNWLVALVIVFTLLIVWWWLSWGRMPHGMGGGHMMDNRTMMGGGAAIVSDIRLPELNDVELAGKAAFGANCAVCHGKNAAGVEGAGPPLIHKIYEPSHHGDGAFVVAARNGVRAHHWQFGNMPAVEGVSDEEILNIIAYVRRVQRENGIH